jgi:anaerobic magnesium-protoporphyrin IX monomethyl ester cyclase
MKKKKFILVEVPTLENAYHKLEDFVAVPIPIGLTSIAAVIENMGYEVRIIDGNVERLAFNETIDRVVAAQPDFIGSTTMTAAMDIIAKFYSELKIKLPNATVIVGGPHASALPQRTLKEISAIDFVVKGEGEEAIVELMQAIDNGSGLERVKGIAFRRNGIVVENNSRSLIEDLNKLPIPAYHLLEYNLYRSYGWNGWVSGHRRPIGVVFTSRGCYGKCSFCATKSVFGQRMRFFALDRIKQEIDLLVEKYKIKILYFQDDTFTANKKLVNEICDYLDSKGYNKKLEIMVSTRPDGADLSLFKKMRKSGIRWICFGVESGNQKILDLMHKNTTIEQIKNAFAAANKAGLFVLGNFIFGTLGETWDTAMETIRLACEMKLDYAAFSLAIPLPGSELYQYCLESNIKLPSWNSFGNVNSPPIQLNDSLEVNKLLKLRRLAINKFFIRPSYILRMLFRFNAIVVMRDFIKMGMAVREEIRQKRY